ncbi:hypothetical protein [Nonomuraea sp. NPDC001699]
MTLVVTVVGDVVRTSTAPASAGIAVSKALILRMSPSRGLRRW